MSHQAGSWAGGRLTAALLTVAGSTKTATAATPPAVDDLPPEGGG